MRSACPCCLKPVLADEFHFFSSSKTERRQRSSENDGEKSRLCQNRTNLHDTCETSVISINRHYTTVNLGKVKTPNMKKKINPNYEETFLAKATRY